MSNPRRRPRYALVGVTAVATLLALVVIGGAIQLSRPLPATYAVRSLPASFTIPGDKPAMPWPKGAQASIEVLGVGSFGSSGGTKPVPIASTAKMMTAYVILTDHPLAVGKDGPTITVTAADVADYDADVAANDSAAAVTLGERITERAALEALLIPSADNIARMLATWDAGSKEAFLTKMMAAADDLGMHDTHYTDPSGLDPTTTSTALDQIKLASKAIAVPVFAKIVAMKRVTLPVAGTVKNYNSLLGQNGIVGIKTGSTSAAGGCLVFAAHRTVGGHTYTIIGAVLGAGRGGPFVDLLPKVTADSRRLIVKATNALHTYTIVHRGQGVAALIEPLGANTVVLAGADITVTGWPGLTYGLSTNIATPRKATAGSALGTIEASGHGTAASISAVVQDAIVPPGLRARLTRR